MKSDKPKISIKHNKQWWDSMPVEGQKDPQDNRPVAELVLTDDCSDGGYNHPYVAVNFMRRGSTDKYVSYSSYGNAISVCFRFQRNLKNGDDYWRPALGYMDTKRQWSRSYAGRVELSRDCREIEIRDRPFELDAESAIKAEMARRVARVIEEFKLHQQGDECTAVVEAIERLGIPVVKSYRTPGWHGRRLPLAEVDNLGANAGAGYDRLVRLWTNAPQGYDFADVLQDGATAHADGREGRWVLIPYKSAENQRNRYASGLYVVMEPEQFRLDCEAHAARMRRSDENAA